MFENSLYLLFIYCNVMGIFQNKVLALLSILHKGFYIKRPSSVITTSSIFLILFGFFPPCLLSHILLRHMDNMVFAVRQHGTGAVGRIP